MHEYIFTIQALEMLTTGHAHSKNFKTVNKYGYQPVILSSISKRILQFYLTYYRPISSVKSPLLLLPYSTDTQAVSVSREVKRFFKNAGYTTTTTALRTLIETLAETMLRNNEISVDTRMGITNINGHSSQTCTDYYNLMDRNQDVRASRSMFNAVIPSLANDDIAQDAKYCSNKHIIFGRDHPAAHVVGKKVTWSADEKEYLKIWKQKHVIATGDEIKALPRCLHQIYEDEAAHPIFHEHHVLNSQRLRHGYEHCGV